MDNSKRKRTDRKTQADKQKGKKIARPNPEQKPVPKAAKKQAGRRNKGPKLAIDNNIVKEMAIFADPQLVR
jgi:hypothetical protein